MSKEYGCTICNGRFDFEEVCLPDNNWKLLCRCKYCANEIYFKNIAVCYILNQYDLRFGEYPDELLEIEIVRAKLRWVIRGNETKYITYKTENMITQVNNSTELRQALNENLHALLTKKRKLLVAKEVNNTLGKFLIDVKMEIMQNAMTGNRETISWFEDKRKEIGEQYGVTPRIKQTE